MLEMWFSSLLLHPLLHFVIATTRHLGYKSRMKGSRESAHCSAKSRCRIRAAIDLPQTGFSLIEVLIVIALILILTTLYWGSSSGSRQRRQQLACQKNLQKLFIALDIYANDHAGKFPNVASARTSEEALALLVPRYTADTSVFICPGSNDSPLPTGESFLKKRISYAYYMGRRSAEASEVLMSDRQVDTQSKIAGQYVFSSTGKAPGNNHDKYGGNFLFCDGHADLSPAQATFSVVLTQGVVLLNPK